MLELHVTVVVCTHGVYVNLQAVFLGHQGVDVHAVCLQNKISQMTVEENGLTLLYGLTTTDNRLVSIYYQQAATLLCFQNTML